MSAGFRLIENARLDARNTFGVPATAPMLVEVADVAALPELFGYAMLRDGPVLVLGGGSNLLFAGDPPGATLALTAQRIEMLEDDGTGAIVRADAGVAWHDFVLWTLGHGLCGLENLALIPGTVGAAPIQNIGAYGVEVRERIHAVEAFDRKSGGFVRFAAGACEFAYRDSLFKRDPEHYIVVAVEFALSRTPALKLEYAGIGEELQAMGVEAAPRDNGHAVVGLDPQRQQMMRQQVGLLVQFGVSQLPALMHSGNRVRREPSLGFDAAMQGGALGENGLGGVELFQHQALFGNGHHRELIKRGMGGLLQCAHQVAGDLPIVTGIRIGGEMVRINVQAPTPSLLSRLPGNYQPTAELTAVREALDDPLPAQ